MNCDGSSHINSTQASSDCHDNPNIQMAFKIIIFGAYSLIFCFGVVGNSLVMYLVARSPELRTPTYIFIANLAISDIVLCTLAAPFTPLSGLLESWVFGDALCKLVPMVLCLCVHVSTQTSAAIAIERYFVIVYPFKNRMTLKKCVIIICCIWLVSTLLSLPLVFNQTNLWDDREQIYDCREHWPDASMKRLFTLASLCLQYLGPCSVIAFCYSRVSLALRERAKVAARRSSVANRQQGDIRRKRRTNKMLIAMIVSFVMAWMPLNIMLIVWEFKQEIEKSPFFVAIFFLSHLVAISSTIYNPVLYVWMNELFRVEYKRLLPCYNHSNDRSVSMNRKRKSNIELINSMKVPKTPS